MSVLGPKLAPFPESIRLSWCPLGKALRGVRGGHKVGTYFEDYRSLASLTDRPDRGVVSGNMDKGNCITSTTRSPLCLYQLPLALSVKHRAFAPRWLFASLSASGQ